MNADFSPNPVTDLRELLAYPFMVHALEAGTIVAVVAGLAGWFMVLRRETFAGHTLSVMSFPGASLAALAGVPLAYGYFGFCALAALLIAAASSTGQRRSLSQSSATIGTIQAAGLALGFLFLSLYGGVLESLETLLFGSILGVTTGEVTTLLVVGPAVVAFFAVVGRPLLYSSVDEPIARAGGVPVRGLHVAYLVVLGLTVAATVQVTGFLLVFALLVAPAAAARELTPRLALGLALTVVIGLVVVWVGLGLAYFTDDPAGFWVTTVAFAIYVAARGRRIAAGALRPVPA
jgi:zinc/manganese transport system permease protein